MGNFMFKDSFTRLAKALGLQKEEARILILGLDAAGKTTILYRMKLGEVVTTIPTIGFNVETLVFQNLSLTVWDIGGRDKMRVLYRHYLANTHAFIYVVDSNDRERIEQAFEEMSRFLDEDELRDCPVLILANKQDLPNAMPADEVKNKLVSTIPTIVKRRLAVVPVTATTGEGLTEGFEWLVNQLQTKQSSVMSPIAETIQDLKTVSVTSEKSTFASFIKKMIFYNFKAAQPS